jgi:1-deoxy-D-xylulose-5-phosphate reductoisomerase
MTKKKINIFGTTGSIGQNTLSVFRKEKDLYDFISFSAYQNVEQLINDCLEFKPKYANIGNEKHYLRLKSALSDTNIIVSYGKNSLLDLAKTEVDWSMSAIVGFAGVQVSLYCAEHSRVLALANKEALVCAGKLLLSVCEKNNTKLVPVDSEHSAIFQCLEGQRRRDLKSITLTASGGPFRDWSLEEMKSATLKQALRHPNWSMGERITIDSASMFNKALELIEAMHLFNLKTSEVEVIIHPQSIIHSMVNFNDGSTIAQMSLPDMRGPIGYSLNYPKRQDIGLMNIDFTKQAPLEFYKPDKKKFRALDIVEKVGLNLELGVVFNAAKEIALDKFISGEIGFLDMAALVEKTLEETSLINKVLRKSVNISDILEVDKCTRAVAKNFVF